MKALANRAIALALPATPAGLPELDPLSLLTAIPFNILLVVIPRQPAPASPACRHPLLLFVIPSARQGRAPRGHLDRRVLPPYSDSRPP